MGMGGAVVIMPLGESYTISTVNEATMRIIAGQEDSFCSPGFMRIIGGRRVAVVLALCV